MQTTFQQLTAEAERLAGRVTTCRFAETINGAGSETSQVHCIVTDRIDGESTFGTVHIVAYTSNQSTETTARIPPACVKHKISLAT